MGCWNTNDRKWDWGGGERRINSKTRTRNRWRQEVEGVVVFWWGFGQRTENHRSRQHRGLEGKYSSLETILGLMSGRVIVGGGYMVGVELNKMAWEIISRQIKCVVGAEGRVCCVNSKKLLFYCHHSYCHILLHTLSFKDTCACFYETALEQYCPTPAFLRHLL